MVISAWISVVFTAKVLEINLLDMGLQRKQQGISQSEKSYEPKARRTYFKKGSHLELCDAALRQPADVRQVLPHVLFEFALRGLASKPLLDFNMNRTRIVIETIVGLLLL
jgi:hypothetical protein